MQTVKKTKFTLRKWLLLATMAVFLAAPAAAFADTQAELEQQLAAIEAQIDQYTSQLAVTKTQKAKLEIQISQLKKKRDALNIQIKQTKLKLNDLNGQIGVTEQSIKDTEAKETIVERQISDILRRINSSDGNILIVLLTSNSLSEAFGRYQNYIQLSIALKNLQEQNKALKAKLVQNQADLEDQKSGVVNLLDIASLQQTAVTGNLIQQNQVMTQTKELVNNYQNMLDDSKKLAAQIRTRIYELFNTGSTINFGQAVDIANWAHGLTGIRPAFLLAILTQESNLGKNVGTCNRQGDPPEKSWKVIMKPDRDQEPFQQITKDLGLNADTTPVSCPMHDKKGNQIGWGGAMGPAQFIPSTWVGFSDKVAALTGKSPANPWDIRDAFLAAALKLTSNGADGTDKGDWTAAMRYFSGGTNPAYSFYGDNVISITHQYEDDISNLNK